MVGDDEMLTIHGKRYIPFARLKEFFSRVDKDQIFVLIRDKKVKSFRVNGHLFVCLEDVQQNMRRGIASV